MEVIEPRSFTVFYDGECPLCKREIAWLAKRTPEGTVNFDDITSTTSSYPSYGLDYDTIMARIHGVNENGDVVQGLDVIRSLYRKANLGWLATISEVPLVRQLCDFGYSVFARLRPYLPGRSSCTEGCKY